MKPLLIILTILFPALTISAQTKSVEEPIKVDPCTIANDPAKYNHKLVEVSGYVSHSFENFSLLTLCETPNGIALEYGGKTGSDTIICCNIAPKQKRPADLEVEGYSIPLIRDNTFDGFNQIIEKEQDTIIKAIVIGRFFSGEPNSMPDGKVHWLGYGHFGMFSLLAIQQVKWFESHDRNDIDYRDTSPGNLDEGDGDTWYNELDDDKNLPVDRVDRLKSMAAMAESNSGLEPLEVAKRYLAKRLNVPAALITGLRERMRLRGAIVYQWDIAKRRGYRVVVNRPYLLMPYLKNPAQFPWLGTNALYMAANDEETTVEDIYRHSRKRRPAKWRKNK